MLRRNSARNKQRRPLSRSKSANSISRSPVHLLEIIDPVAAERDAHIAALISYHKSQNRESYQMPPPLQDRPNFAMERGEVTPSPASQGLERRNSTRSHQNVSEDASGIKRQKSVRFAGPSARPRRNLASRATGAPASDLHVLGNVNNRTALKPSPDPYGFTKHYLESLQVLNEMYTPEDDIASMPSSYRRLRKSKSMFSTFNPLNPGYYFNTGIPEHGKKLFSGHGATVYRKENDPLVTDHPPRPSTSLSILKGRRATVSSRSTSRAENDLAVQLAREKFKDQVQAQTLLKPRPSMFFGSRTKRNESALGFRKSLRSSSNNSTSLSSAFSSHSLSVPKQAGLRTTARKVSKTLRTKLKGLFTRPKGALDLELHENEYHTTESDGETCIPMREDTTPTEASVLRVPSHVPSLHAVSSKQELRSRRGSVESIGSVEKQMTDDKSRVTSWTNSITNTAASAEEWECQNLSVIKENASCMPSSTPFEELPMSRKDGSAGLPTTDSQRVCSALVKKMKEIKRQEEALAYSFSNMQPPLERAVDRSSGGGGWNSSTIRCVRTEDDVFGDPAKSLETELEQGNPENSGNSEKSSTLKRVSSTCDAREAGEDKISISQESCETRTHINNQSTLMQRSSAFFASPTCHLFRTASPYRRALRESMKVSQEQGSTDIPSSRYLRSLSEISLPTRCPSSSESENDARIAYAESVYSCRTEEAMQPVSTMSTSSKLRQNEPLMAQSSGDVKIFTEETVYEIPRQNQRDVSSASSVEWKTWLSAKVSKLDDSDASRKISDGRIQQNMLPVRGHVRERAEIDSPQEISRVVTVDADGSPIRNPLGSIRGNARSNCTVMTSDTNQSKTTVPLDENDDPCAIVPPGLRRGPPKVPPRSQRRLDSSLSERHNESRLSHSTSPTERIHERSFNSIYGGNSLCNDANKKRHEQHIFEQSGSPTKSSPSPEISVERQLTNKASGSPAFRAGYHTGQSTPRSRKRVEAKDEKSQRTRRLDSETPVMGSKQMVDMFLDSRRKRALGDVTGTEKGSSPAAFL